MDIKKWNHIAKEYEPYTPDPSWKLILFTTNMDEEVNCANCGKPMTYGEGYTSRVLHNRVGLGYPVDEDCYFKEEK